MANSSGKGNTDDTIYMELRRKLHNEIAKLKHTLRTADSPDTTLLDSIADCTRDTLVVSQTISDKGFDARKHNNYGLTTQDQFPNPIHDLLSVGQLSRGEIPLDIIKMMITVGFDMNDTAGSPRYRGTCLKTAILCKHFNVVRLLVNHGAQCFSLHFDSYGQQQLDDIPAIVLLAGDSTAPQDLFDTLAPSAAGQLSDALCAAVLFHCTDTALHLIKLGASVDKSNVARVQTHDTIFANGSHLPIFYLNANSTTFTEELLAHLLPSRASSVDIFRPLCRFLRKTDNDKTIVWNVLQQLIQRLAFMKMPLKIQLSFVRNSGRLTLNNEVVLRECYDRFSLIAYLCNFVLVELQHEVAYISPDMTSQLAGKLRDEFLLYTRAFDDLKRTYLQRSKVKSLLMLCIMQTRNSMGNLHDDSFLSLPVPPIIRRLLTYHFVADKVYEEWCEGISKL